MQNYVENCRCTWERIRVRNEGWKVVASEDFLLLASPYPQFWLNWVWGNPEKHVQQVANELGHLQCTWEVPYPASPAADSLLKQNGFGAPDPTPEMRLERGASTLSIRPYPQRTIREIRDRQDTNAWAKISADVFDFSFEEAALVLNIMVEHGGCTALLALDAGTPVGIVLLSPSPQSVGVSYMAVLPSARRSGVGSHLMHAAIQWAEARALPLTLYASKDGFPLYQKAGFKTIASWGEYEPHEGMDS